MSRRRRRASAAGSDDDEDYVPKRARREEAVAEVVAAGYNWLNLDEPAIPDDVRLMLVEELRPVDMDKVAILLSQATATTATPGSPPSTSVRGIR
jgi:hypothetical protein